MKLTHLLYPAALAVFFATTLPAMAADEKPADAKTDKSEVIKKKVKPHSHVEEKTGVPAKAVDEAKPEDKDAKAKQKKQHLHPRDGK